MPNIYSYVEVFSPLGVRQLPDFGSALPHGLNDAQAPASIGVGTANLVVTEKSEVDDWVGFDQFAADRSCLGETNYDYVPGTQHLPPHLVATNASDQIAFAGHPDESLRSDSSGLVLVKYDAARHEFWRVERDPLGENDYIGGDGFDLADVAIAPDGRIAVLDKRSLVEVFAP